MDVVLDAADARVRPARTAPPRTQPAVRIWRSELVATLASAAAVLFVASLSMADGLLNGVVAYERDTLAFYFPLMQWAAQHMRSVGEIPLWTPQVFGGYPIFADGEIGLAYPPALLAMLTLPAERAFILLRLAHLWIAGLGAFALARAWDLPRPSAVLAGVVFSLGHFLQAQIHHENIIRTAAWLPLTLACLEWGLRSSAWDRRTAWSAAAGFALGLAGLSLHSQMLLIDLLVVALYALVRAWAGPFGPSFVARVLAVARVVGPATLLGLSLAAIQLVPLVELARFSARGSGIPYSDSAAYSLTPYGLAQLVFPFVFRGPDHTQWGLWTHWESYIYIGLAPLVLVCVALWFDRRREVLGWALLAGVGLVLALGQYSPINLHYLLWLMPGISGLRAPGRFTVLVVLAGGMLAAYGLAWLLRHAALPRGWIGRAFAAVLALALMGALLRAALLVWPAQIHAVISFAYLSLSRDSHPLTESDVYAGLLWSTDPTNPRVLGVLLGLSLVMLALWIASQSRESVRCWRGWPLIFVGLTAVDLLVFAWGVHPRAALSRLAPDPAATNALKSLVAQHDQPVRVLASPVLNQVAADQLAPHGIQEANGYSSLQFTWHRDYLTRVLEVDDDILDVWNVRYVLDPSRFGSLPSHGGVTFLPGQRVLQSPAGSALAEQTFAVRPGSTVQEVRLITALVGAVDVQQNTLVGEVEVRDSENQVLARAPLLAGRDTMEWAYDVSTARPFIRHARVESAGVIFEPGAKEDRRLLSFARVPFEIAGVSRITLRAVSPRGELMIFGAAVAGPDGEVQQLFGRTRAKFQEVYADSDLRIFENTSALPRAFVVDRARWAPSIGASLSEMIHRPFEPRQEVILANDTPESLAARYASGGTGSDFRARVESYAPHAIRVTTRTDADALLVLSDTYYPGWRAFVDGREEPILRGDLLFRAVPIPAGEHTVDFHFEPLSVRIGLLVSVVAFVIGLSALLVAGVGHLRGRTT